MSISMKHVWWSMVLCVASSMCQAQCVTDCGSTVAFSFDQLYPTTSVSHTLNSLRSVWSLAQDLNDDQYNVDKVRHAWLDLYGACSVLAAHVNAHQASLVMQGLSSNQSFLKDDMRDYIQTTWHMICSVYNQIVFKDESLRHFLGHIRSACTQLIDLY